MDFQEFLRDSTSASIDAFYAALCSTEWKIDCKRNSVVEAITTALRTSNPPTPTPLMPSLTSLRTLAENATPVGASKVAWADLQNLRQPTPTAEVLAPTSLPLASTHPSAPYSLHGLHSLAPALPSPTTPVNHRGMSNKLFRIRIFFQNAQVFHRSIPNKIFRIQIFCQNAQVFHRSIPTWPQMPLGITPNIGGLTLVTWIPLTMGGLRPLTRTPQALPRAHTRNMTATARVLGGLVPITINPTNALAPMPDFQAPAPPAPTPTTLHHCPTMLVVSLPACITVASMAWIATSPWARTFSILLASPTPRCTPKIMRIHPIIRHSWHNSLYNSYGPQKESFLKSNAFSKHLLLKNFDAPLVIAWYERLTST
jgi:hypothetical protein